MFYNAIKTKSSDYRVLTRNTMIFHYVTAFTDDAAKIQIIFLKSSYFIYIFIVRQ